MCGISFVIHSNHQTTGFRSIKYTQLFEDMLVAGAVRGTDSTGCFQITRDNKVFYGKSGETSGAAVNNSTSIKAVIKSADEEPITVGHVRAATQGDVNEANAHPFIGHKNNAGKDYIIGVHNGTLYGWEYHGTAHDVDSAWAYQHLAEKGIAAFEDFYGAYAMVWFDTEHPGKVFLGRNKERPLSIARSMDGKSIIGASEAGMLQWLAKRNDIEIGEVYSLDEDNLFSIDTTEAELSVMWERELPDYVSSRYTPPKGPMVVTQPPPFSSIASQLSANVMDAIEWPSDSAKRQETLGAIKESLRRARCTVLSFTPENDGEAEDVDTPFEMGPTDFLMKAKADWYSDADVTDEEKRRAMYDGSYGNIIQFEGITYDDFATVVVGEITMPSVYKNALGYVPVTGPFEFCIYEERLTPMVVVGASLHKGEKEYILAPLNEKGEEAIAA